VGTHGVCAVRGRRSLPGAGRSRQSHAVRAEYGARRQTTGRGPATGGKRPRRLRVRMRVYDGHEGGGAIGMNLVSFSLRTKGMGNFARRLWTVFTRFGITEER